MSNTLVFSTNPFQNAWRARLIGWWLKMSRLIQWAKVFPQRPGYKPADPKWVQQGALRARSPFTQQNAILKMLVSDQDFLAMIPRECDVLLELSVTSVDLRANLYLVAVGEPTESDHTHTPVYDPTWPSTGIYRYLINAAAEVQFLLRDRPGYTYDTRDIVYSYGRELTPAEREYVIAISRF